MSTETVPKGYKCTEVGVIPEEWECVTIGEICRSFSGGTPNTSISAYYVGDIPWITSSDLNAGVISEVSGKISKDGLENSSAKMVESGTLLIALYGATAGVCAVSKICAAINQAVLAILPSRDDNRFLYQCLILRKSHNILTYTQGGQPNLSGEIVKSFRLPVPPLPEQQAIAAALSDADAWIESLEALLAKKRQIKQGAMQELLTGKRRLPGFTGKWETKRLGEMSKMASGGTPSSLYSGYYDGDIPWVSIADMTKQGKFISETDRNISELGLRNSAAQLFPAGAILYAMYASIGECSIAASALTTSQAILGIQPSAKLDAIFLYFFLCSLRDTVKLLGQQGTQANLNKGIVQGFQIPVPPLPEQSAIASVLSDMDAEIEAIEGKLEKARQIKQGMMQELLTGKTRLV